MSLPRIAQRRAPLLVLCAAAALAGCVPLDPQDVPSWPEEVMGYVPPEPTASGSPPDSSPPAQTPTDAIPADPPPANVFHAESEPNDDWQNADYVPFGVSLELAGTIAAGFKDRDVFDLGPASAGQRLEAAISVSGGTDVQIGFLDEAGRILAFVDPMSTTAGPDHVDIVLRESTERVYAVVATRSSSTTVRSYSAAVRLGPGALPSGGPQVVVLVLRGSRQVRIGSRPPVDVPPFDIAAVNPLFAGRTEEAARLLLDIVREDYEGLNVAFYRDGDPSTPEGEQTRIYFGTSDARLLGLADNIDPFNGDPTQSAILYTDTFSLFNPLQPGFESTVQVLANVTSHEVGHLLGLRHTADPEGLMDVTATARQMLTDQWFKVSSLHASVLPLGLQDAPAMLSWSLGGVLQPRPAAKLYTARSALTAPAGAVDDFYIPRSLLADCGCVECDAGAGEFAPLSVGDQ